MAEKSVFHVTDIPGTAVSFAAIYFGETEDHIALVGNPNSGKSSIFNCLTGMHQRVGNFPG